MPQFAQQRNGLQPTKTLFDTLPFLLPDTVAGVPGGASIVATPASPRKVLRHMWRHMKVAAFLDELRGVETLVPSHGPLPVSRKVLQHVQRGITFGRSRGFPYSAVHYQSVAILHQQIAAVTQLGLLAGALPRQLGIRIALRFVRLVRTLFTMKVHRGISRVVRWRRTL